MDEIQLWQCRYTDQFGKRRVYPCRLSEEDAKHLQGAERVEGSLEIRKPLGLDQRLADLAKFVHSGQHHECAWDLFRYGQFKGLSDEEAGAQLGAWARRRRIDVTFGVDALFLVMAARKPDA